MSMDTWRHSGDREAAILYGKLGDIREGLKLEIDEFRGRIDDLEQEAEVTATLRDALAAGHSES